MTMDTQQPPDARKISLLAATIFSFPLCLGYLGNPGVSKNGEGPLLLLILFSLLFSGTRSSVGRFSTGLSNLRVVVVRHQRMASSFLTPLSPQVKADLNSPNFPNYPLRERPFRPPRAPGKDGQSRCFLGFTIVHERIPLSTPGLLPPRAFLLEGILSQRKELALLRS